MPSTVVVRVPEVEVAIASQLVMVSRKRLLKLTDALEGS